jgi:hypothetical protein
MTHMIRQLQISRRALNGTFLQHSSPELYAATVNPGVVQHLPDCPAAVTQTEPAVASGRASTSLSSISNMTDLDERNMDPVDLTVRCRGGEAKRFRLHRRLDAYAHKMFIVAEETPQPGAATHPVPKNSASQVLR